MSCLSIARTQNYIVVAKFKLFIAVCIFLFAHTCFGQVNQELINLMQSGDVAEARRLALRLAQKNDPFAIYTLAVLEKEKKTKSGDISAFNYMKKAATLGSRGAMAGLADMYLEGVGTRKNINEAITWLNKAYLNGNHLAPFKIGMIYLGEYGTSPDLEKAYAAFSDVAKRDELQDTDEWVLSLFHIGRMTVNSPEREAKAIAEYAFSEVMKSKRNTPKVNWARENVQLYTRQGLTQAGDFGDRSPPTAYSSNSKNIANQTAQVRPLSGDELTCQQLGFIVDSTEFVQCKQRFEISRRELAQRQREYEIQRQRYELERQQYAARLAEYERLQEEERRRRITMLGLGLMAGRSPNFSENLANAARMSLGQPPLAPTPQSASTFTITSPQGMKTCNVAGTMINCF